MPRHRPRNKLLAPLLLGLMVLGVAAACLATVAALEQPSLGLRQLVSTEDVVLMSCDPSLATSAPAPDHEPLWCANPDSPHCQPGHQTPSHSDPSLGPVTAFAAPVASGSVFLWSEASHWPAQRSAALYAYAPSQRLERPPRHA